MYVTDSSSVKMTFPFSSAIRIVATPLVEVVKGIVVEKFVPLPNGNYWMVEDGPARRMLPFTVLR